MLLSFQTIISIQESIVRTLHFCTTGRASPMPNQREAPNVARRVAGPDDELGPLPEGWEERVHSDGRIFFIDHSKLVYKYSMAPDLVSILKYVKICFNIFFRLLTHAQNLNCSQMFFVL